MVEWSRAFGGVPIHLHADDHRWIMRPDRSIQLWNGETLKLLPDVTLIRCGGHFPGGTVLRKHGRTQQQGGYQCERKESRARHSDLLLPQRILHTKAPLHELFRTNFECAAEGRQSLGVAPRALQEVFGTGRRRSLTSSATNPNLICALPGSSGLIHRFDDVARKPNCAGPPAGLRPRLP
jgi:hypothetical protein